MAMTAPQKETKREPRKPTDRIEKLLKRKLTTTELAIFIAGHLAGQQKAERDRKVVKP